MVDSPAAKVKSDDASSVSPSAMIDVVATMFSFLESPNEKRPHKEALHALA